MLKSQSLATQTAAANSVTIPPKPTTIVFQSPPDGRPPEGWEPFPAWQPDPSWPAAPEGWQFWAAG